MVAWEILRTVYPSIKTADVIAAELNLQQYPLRESELKSTDVLQSITTYSQDQIITPIVFSLNERCHINFFPQILYREQLRMATLHEAVQFLIANPDFSSSPLVILGTAIIRDSWAYATTFTKLKKEKHFSLKVSWAISTIFGKHCKFLAFPATTPDNDLYPYPNINPSFIFGR